ncbi:hypothetical protein PVMG_04090 [Plasmodium vivax Mauritania I]|uniref:Uncharacterized protein n=1 Tax=Plasmodium vivax Mauritania I TaxID=1035515 RepID=A0A0J9T7F3_PLAVI|nr:hypothetical protein PVMG_04090 [Plasmodium vivax Mauritania I]
MEKKENAEWDVQNYACNMPVKKGRYFGENAKVLLLVMRHLHKRHDHQSAIYGAMKKTNFLSNIKCGVLLLLVLYKNRKKASLVADLSVKSGAPGGVLSHGEETYSSGDAGRDDEQRIYLDRHSRGRTASPPKKKNKLLLRRSGDGAAPPFCKNANCVKVTKKIGYHKRTKRRGNVHARFHRVSSSKWSCCPPKGADLEGSEQPVQSIQSVQSAHSVDPGEVPPLAEWKNCSTRRTTIVKTPPDHVPYAVQEIPAKGRHTQLVPSPSLMI